MAPEALVASVAPVTPVTPVAMEVAPPPEAAASGVAVAADPAVASTVGLVEQPYSCEGDAVSLLSVDR